jgi:hypothetical protein
MNELEKPIHNTQSKERKQESKRNDVRGGMNYVIS